jgi:alginate O-acetyltransferase complex protein AlgI
MLVDYYAARYLEKQKSIIKRKIVLAILIVGNLLLLGFFKYTPFVLGSILTVHPSSLISSLSFYKSLIIPVGISFITFQRISYEVDIYRKKIKASKNLLQYASYALLFPHLISGPIVRYSFIQDQLKKRKISSKLLFDGMKYFIVGLSLKLLIADKLYIVESSLSTNLSKLHSIEALILLFYFSFRIYLDFCGYSLIAIGLAKLMGFEFPHNFNSPYQALNITDFWRRWNITLSRWLRDYLYIPLGGNRKGKVRTYINLIITMILGGLWHGASWNFVLWGFLHGAYLAIERFLSDKKITIPLPLIVKRYLTFLLVTVTWLTFLFKSPADISMEITKIFQLNFTAPSLEISSMLKGTIFAIITAIIWAFFLKEEYIEKIKPSFITTTILIFIFIVCLYNALWGGGVPFIYFQF